MTIAKLMDKLQKFSPDNKVITREYEGRCRIIWR